ncbi:MAG: flagellar hook-associated protein FlgK [Gammaproteobacteria bacterium]
MSELLRIATSSLVANQAALTTTGHNIANAGVEGYSRQRLELGTRPPQFISGAFFGRGVDIQTVERTVDEFVSSQLRADTWLFNASETFRFYGEQLDTILNDPAVGLGDRVNSFFGALQASADDPVWLPNRQVTVNEGKVLAERFNNLYARLSDINGAINAQLDGLAGDIDTLARGIADLNTKIATAEGSAGGDMPNDLLDQRDKKLLELSRIVDITTVRDGRSINVLLGKGDALVVGSLANRVTTVAGTFDPSRRELAIVQGGLSKIVSGDSTGGKAGGLITFRTGVLDQAFNQIGRMAVGVVENINRQHALGMDLEGDLGGLFFTDLNAGTAPAQRARPAGDNPSSSTGLIEVDILDSSALSTSGYQLDVLPGGSWRLYRGLDGEVVASGSSLPVAPPQIDAEGFRLRLSGTFVAGDSYLIEPTRGGSRDIAMALSRPEDLALAQPVRADAATGNQGVGKIEVTEVFDTSTALFQTAAGALSPPLLLRFTSATAWEVLNANTSAVIDTGTFAPGVPNTLFSTTVGDPDYFGFQVRISGDPVAGDTFSIGYNTGGVSDNRNALALGRLQLADTLAGGTTTIQGAYGQVVGFVGSETRRARIEAEAGQALVDRSEAAREEVSGVNLDEEATNLIKFQQAYQATAQVIAIARSVIDSLLDAVS